MSEFVSSFDTRCISSVVERPTIPENCFIGVDVGSTSVRAALVGSTGKVFATSVQKISIFSPAANYFEQSSNEIWQACCHVIKDVSRHVSSEWIKGIGFDATCSLVAIGKDGRPITISPEGDETHNVIMWMDHRADEEADFINQTKHDMLKYLGGNVSIEMQVPKLLWLKKHLPNTCWESAGYFFDLPDFLTWKATGSDSRSLCSVVCKWMYEVSPEGHSGWNKSFFDEIGLSDLAENDWVKIGNTIQSPGDPCGKGLNSSTAELVDLPPGIPVGTSIIDAHSGALGLLGCQPTSQDKFDFPSRLALIAGTSSCHLIMTKSPVFVPGVWGPYYGVMVDQYWVNEGGMSATGLLVEHLIERHPAFEELKLKLGDKSFQTINKSKFSEHIKDKLSETLEELSKKSNIPLSHLTHNVHVWPDFYGNRSPLADVSLRGMVSGMTLLTCVEELACLYLSIIQALAYATRHIMEAMEKSGHKISTILISGGLRKNQLFVQTHADILGVPVILPHETESMLVGSAILGAVASKEFESTDEAILQMAGTGDVVTPDLKDKKYHDAKYKVFLTMVEDQRKYQNIMVGHV